MSSTADISRRPGRFADELYPDAAALRRAFSDPHPMFGPYLYFPIVLEGENASLSRAGKVIAGYRKDGYAGVIPYYPSEGDSRPFGEGYMETMHSIYRACAENGLFTGYFDDHLAMESYLQKHPDYAEELDCRILTDYEHECVAGQTFTRTLEGKGKLMALVAVEADSAEMLDLRQYITEDNRIVWDVPEGNWILHRYMCEPDHEAELINLLDYNCCMRYFSETVRPILEPLEDKVRETVRFLICRNVQYGGKNRRMWSEDFNEVFRQKYGFDPAPYYPCLFQEAGPSSFHYRALMMNCRAAMLTDGYMKAAADFAASRGMAVTSFAIESKATACSWLFGDGQMLHRHSHIPGVSMPFHYLYGLNGIKVSAGISDAMERGLVSADMFRRYPSLTEDIVHRETLNAFVRGVNVLFTHLGEDREDPAPAETGTRSSLSDLLSTSRPAVDYTDFCARAGMLLRGGRHVVDTAVLYPIHSIHARTFLYEFTLKGFEYPAVLENADYMTVMNNLLTYACTDAEFLHPDIFSESCCSDGGTLYRNTGSCGGRYSTVILPGTDVISIRAMRLLAKFYDDGGKILATGCLPTHAFELDEPISCSCTEDARYDAEVRSLCEHIFGHDSLDTGVFREYYVNENEKGGIACFVPAITTAVDGTDMVPAAAMTDILNAFGLKPDFHFVRPPKIEYSGVVAYDLPTYRKVSAAEKLSRGGSLGCLHRKNELCDVFFITNTTSKTYENDLLLRGVHQPEEWNPYKGKIHKMNCEYVRWQGEVYTLVKISVPAASGTFLVSPNPAGNKEALRTLTAAENLREYFTRR